MKIQMLIEIEMNDREKPSDPDEADWFWNHFLKEDLILHSNDIGDSVGDSLKVIEVKEV